MIKRHLPVLLLILLVECKLETFGYKFVEYSLRAIKFLRHDQQQPMLGLIK